MTDTAPTAAPATARRSPVDYTALVLVAAAGMLMLAGLIYAFAVADLRNVDGTERFRLLAQASSPFIAGLALAAIMLIVHQRRRGEDSPQVAASAALAVGSMVSLLALLLAVNGVIVDLSSGDVGGLFRLSNVVGRLATIGLGGFALWMSSTTPLKPTGPVVENPDRPVHS